MPDGTIATRRPARRTGSPAKSDRTSRLRARSADRERAGDPRLSIEERYRSRDEYVGRIAAAALDLVKRGYLLEEDVVDLLKRAVEHYDFATKAGVTVGGKGRMGRKGRSGKTLVFAARCYLCHTWRPPLGGPHELSLPAFPAFPALPALSLTAS